MGADYGSSGSPGPISNFNIPLLILFIHVQLFSVVPLGVFGGPEKDRCFGFWALSIAPHGYALPAGDPLVLSSPSLRVSRTSSCP